jgi:hypothetical protein
MLLGGIELTLQPMDLSESRIECDRILYELGTGHGAPIVTISQLAVPVPFDD